jgi:thiol-disulfide isomerase/thioredoxin
MRLVTVWGLFRFMRSIAQRGIATTMMTALLLLCAGAFAQNTLPAAGRRAPDLELRQILQAPAGTQWAWSTLRGKAVVLEFWATWCGAVWRRYRT